jgi:ligand-binding sensor domain-containing protein
MKLSANVSSKKWSIVILQSVYRVVIILWLSFTLTNLFAQTEIPIGTWRVHISYNNITSIAVADTKVFGATENGVMMLDKSDNSITSFSRLDGLSGADISYIGYDENTSKVIIGYDDGNLDLITNNHIENFNRLANSTSINASKKINHITTRAGYAYLSTDYGLVVFDLNALEVKETWRDLGSNGSTLKITASTFKGDSVFLGTEKGIIAGNINTNLLDYNNWKRYDQGELATNIQGLATFNNDVYAIINNQGVYHNENGSWNKEAYLQGVGFNSISASTSNIIITESTNVWQLNSSNDLTQITDSNIVQPNIAIQDTQGKFWIGDAINGLVTNASGSFQSLIPNGPKSNSVKLTYFNSGIYSSPGGYSSTFSALDNNGGIDLFTNGLWSNLPSTVKDITDVAFISADKYYAASFGYGVEERNAQGTVQVFDDSNSPLVNLNPPGKFVNITALENSDAGLWIANYGSITSLQLLRSDASWESYAPPLNVARYPTDIRVDLNGYVWAALNPTQGGGLLVFNKETNSIQYLTDIVGNGALPSKSVRALAVDRDGYVWVGTDLGIAYFIDTYNIFTSISDAVKPIIDNRYLLRNEKVNVIKVDAANRKWVGTDKGVWLFSPSGESQLQNFTTDNSPLLSNVIRDIEINSLTGEVFFATDKGIISYRADATISENTFQDVKIFPNPVTSNFTGTVGISGLATDAIVKITDINGRLLWETQAAGGTATWNVRDYHGNRAGTGVYVVFAASQDGVESAVGKIAVVE